MFQKGIHWKEQTIVKSVVTIEVLNYYANFEYDFVVHCSCHFRSALSTLDQVALHAENLRKTIKELNSEHTTASSVSSSLLTDLTNAACAVEKLKARLGKGSYFITAFSYANELHLQELIDTEEELEEDLLGAYVEGYDHQRERLLDAIQEIERNQIPLGKQLSDCQEQVRNLDDVV